MKLNTHIAHRFLTDPTLVQEIIETMYPECMQVADGTFTGTHVSINGQPIAFDKSDYMMKLAASYTHLDTPKGHKPYYCTNTMLECLEHLRVDKYDWTLFKGLPNQIATFIFEKGYAPNDMLRMEVNNHILAFTHIRFEKLPNHPTQGELKWVMFWLNRNTGELCEHFAHKDVKAIEGFIFRLLCFVYLTENSEVIVPPNGKHGTRTQGKLINSTPLPVVIINSKWNITSIRTEGFAVDGYFGIRHTGPGRGTPKLVLVEPYEKKGYKRIAKSTSIQH